MLGAPKVGFLFDVDGTLTTYRRNDSMVDLLIINDLNQIRKRKLPIGLVTGRSVNWVRNFFFDHIDESLREYIYIAGEFGLVTFYQGKKRLGRLEKVTKENLLKAKEEMTTAICDYLQLEPIISYDPPDQRYLWIEPKDLMITFRSLPMFGLTSEKYQRIVEPILEKYSETLKIVPNKYALDVLPIKASKERGAKKVIKKLDPEREVKKWFAFGDTEADREMGKARKIDFYQVTQGKTSETHSLIEKALAGYLKLR